MPDHDDPTPRHRPRAVERIAANAQRMPSGHKKILAIGAVLTAVGLGWQGVNRLTAGPAAAPRPRPVVVEDGSRVPGTDGDRRGFVGGAPTASSDAAASDRAADEAAADEPRAGASGRMPVWMTRVGGSFLLGFVIGFAFRTFIKLTAVVTAVIATVFAGLSYFDVLKIDTDAARRRYDTTADWVQAKAGEMKDRAMGYVPHSAAGFVGAFVGFRRK